MKSKVVWLAAALGTAVGLLLVLMGAVTPAQAETPVSAGAGITAYGLATSGLYPEAAWDFESDQVEGYLAYRVASAGDVNGDGYADVIVGAHGYDVGGTPVLTDAGRAYLFYGSSRGLNTTADWIADGDKAHSAFGGMVNTAGDVNEDGYDDVLIGAYGYDIISGTDVLTDAGRVYLYLGSAGGLAEDPAWVLDGDQENALLGLGAATAGDLNGDGADDIIVSAEGYVNAPGNKGRVYVFHGASGGLAAEADWTAQSMQDTRYFGRRVGTVGDVNGDGFDDIFVASPEYSNGSAYEGAVFVWYGGSSGLGLDGTPGNADWMAESDNYGFTLGWGAAGAGDIDGDGYDDLIAGAPLYNSPPYPTINGRGAAFAWYGSEDGLNEGANGTLTNADWSVIGDQLNGYLGRMVAPAGDVNGDNYADVLVGAYIYDNPEVDEGRAYLFLGGESGLASTAAWTGESNQANAGFGFALGAAGDVNGDGYDDALAGAYAYSNGQDKEGRAYLYRGWACRAKIDGADTIYDTVQDAVDAASGGDRVMVSGYCPGVSARAGVTQSITLDKAITLAGGYHPDFSTVPDPTTYPTTLDALGEGRVLHITGDIAPVVEGLRITGGDAAGQGGAGPDDDGGGGIFVEGGAPTIRDCWIYGNTADIGGGVLLGNTTAALIDNAIYENSAGDGGGVGTGFASPIITGNEIYSNTGQFCGGGLNIYETDGTFANNVVRNNEADWGGGLCVVDSGLALTSNEILTNTADSHGGGLILDNAPATVTGNLIQGNEAATGSGGGVMIEGEACDGAALSDNEIAYNTAHWVGAGVFVNSASPTLTGNWIHHNTGNEGSGITSSWSEALISGNTIEHNSADWRGGGLALRDDSALTLEANLIRHNEAAWDGGGVFAVDSAPVLTNNAIIDNGLTENGDGDGLCIDTSTPRLLHNTLSSNSGGKGYGIYVGAGSTATLTNTIVVSQTTGVFVDTDGAATVNGVLWYSNGADTDGDVTIVGGNAYSGVPAFEADGYHLTRASAAIDRGVAVDVTIDIDGDSRPLNYGLDLGADEYAGDLVLPEVVGREPGPEATDVAVDAAIVITFSEAIDTGSFAYTVAPDPGGWSAAWRAGDTVVSLSHLDFAVETRYTVTVSAADDVAGNALGDAPVAWAFTTGEEASHQEAPAITSADGTTFVAGAAGSFMVTATGAPTPAITVSDGLPAGVTFTDNGNGTASLAGTPAAGTGGVYPLTITASNGVAPDATQAFTLTVEARVYLPLVLSSS